MLRNSQLNLIYFVDANKTRSIKISVRSAVALLILFFSVLLWSLSSLFFLHRQIQANSQNEYKIISLLDIIFDYQCRYDHAFDRAYPQTQAPEKIEALATTTPEAPASPTSPPPASTQQNLEKATSRPATPVAPQALKNRETPPTEEIAAADEDVPAAAEESHPTVTQNHDIDVEPLKVASLPQKMQVRFAMRNTDSPKQSEGYVLGVGKFMTDDGKTIYVPTPTDVEIDKNNGKPISMRLGYKFSIKYYKKRTMEFLVPREKNGRFVSAQIFTAHGLSPQGVFEIKIPAEEQAPPRDGKQGKEDLPPLGGVDADGSDQ